MRGQTTSGCDNGSGKQRSQREAEYCNEVGGLGEGRNEPEEKVREDGERGVNLGVECVVSAIY